MDTALRSERKESNKSEMTVSAVKIQSNQLIFLPLPIEQVSSEKESKRYTPITAVLNAIGYLLKVVV